MAHPAINLDDLTPDEQLQLLEQIWDRLSQDPAKVPLSDAQRAELGRRVDLLEDDIRAGRPLGRPWSEVRERLHCHRKTRRLLLPKFPYGHLPLDGRVHPDRRLHPRPTASPNVAHPVRRANR